MAYGDADYRINALQDRIKILENQARASNPGNRPSRGPNHPFQVATSAGQQNAGADSDNFSRTVAGAVNNALANVEALQDNIVATTSVNPVTTGTTLHTTFIRPDPVKGDVYRIVAAGFVGVNFGTAGNTIAIKFSLSTLTATLLLFATSGNLADSFLWEVVLTIVVYNAGINGTIAYSGVGGVTPATGSPVTTPSFSANCNLQMAQGTLMGPLNLRSPVFTLSAFINANDANYFVELDDYIFETLGYRIS